MRKERGCLILVLLFFIIVVPVFTILNFDSIKEESRTTSAEEFKKFDKESWGDFKEIYNAYNNVVGAIGNPYNTTNYQIIVDSKDFFSRKSTQLNYGNTDEQDDYLSSLNVMCISAQTTCKYALKFIDSSKQSDLSKMKEEMERFKSAAILFSKNRATLLKKAGYTEEEIKNLINDLDSDLESVE